MELGVVIEAKMNLAEQVFSKREEVKEICAKFGATDVRLFGSVARGDFNEKSDIDFIVNMDAIKQVKPFKYLGDLELLHEALERLFGRKVDVVEEYGLREEVLDDILDDAIPL